MSVFRPYVELTIRPKNRHSISGEVSGQAGNAGRASVSSFQNLRRHQLIPDIPIFRQQILELCHKARISRGECSNRGHDVCQVPPQN
jgi:hypothetical protein